MATFIQEAAGEMNLFRRRDFKAIVVGVRLRYAPVVDDSSDRIQRHINARGSFVLSRNYDAYNRFSLFGTHSDRNLGSHIACVFYCDRDQITSLDVLSRINRRDAEVGQAAV